MAYAFLAGLPPQTGLYACLVPMLAYTVLGSSRHLVVGPVAVAALMVAAAIGQHAPDFEGGPMAVTTVICVEAGLFLLVLRLTQMGGIVHLLSYPVITGFINAAAVLIILSQLNGFTGIHKEEGAIPIAALWGLITNIGSLNGLRCRWPSAALPSSGERAGTATGSARASCRRSRAPRRFPGRDPWWCCCSPPSWWRSSIST